ncbi:protein of unknown function DUF1271 [Mycolicibacterium rhodesiae JS60]|nr:protein of unknown function DUF1271 [Mycolicibacterium rhodesiae JS60]
MKIVVDLHKCSGLGMCEVEAPGFFEVGDDGYSHVLITTPSEADRKVLEAAVDGCPTRAISLDENG